MDVGVSGGSAAVYPVENKDVCAGTVGSGLLNAVLIR